MNPIPLNDRGQFRYTDFIGYIPEFLQSEPDVVEFLQLMSDYINDAYRNIDTVEEFEFKLCASEPTVGRATETLERMRSMFSLAASRKERVCYLSSPRANVKSNEVIGKANGHTPYYVDVTPDTVQETISNATGIDRKIAEMSDGDVVYAKYVSINPPTTRAYYVSKQDNTLRLDPEWNSQDPFTSTPNDASRMISFMVDDVSSISRRFGTAAGGSTYYEVYFSAKITDVRDEPASYKVAAGGGSSDTGKYDMYVDYYGTEYVERGKLHSTLSFYGTDGWEWKSGYPSGIFYLRETSAGSLVAASQTGTAQMDMPADQSLSPYLTYYSLTSPVVYDQASGTVELHTSTVVPQVDGGTLYLIERVSGKCVAELSTVPADYMEDEYVTTARVNWQEDSDIPYTGMYVATVPLYFNRAVPDVSGSLPVIHWKQLGDAEIEWDTASMYRLMPMGKTETVAEFRLTPHMVVSDTPRIFYVPYDVYAALAPLSGRTVACDADIWGGGMATITSVTEATFDGSPAGRVQLDREIDIDALPDGNIRLITGYMGNIIVRDGAVRLGLDSEIAGIIPDYFTGASYRIEVRNGSLDILARVTEITRPEGNYGMYSAVLDVELPDGDYVWTALYLNSEPAGYASGFSGITQEGSGWMRGIASKYSGDVYTDGVFEVRDRTGEFAGYAETGAGTTSRRVVAFTYESKEYAAGDTVYSPRDGKLYTCIGKYVSVDGEDPAENSRFREDTITRKHVELTRKRNMFMPFYGQVKSMEYGEQIDYSASKDVFSRPLYITKVDEHRLKFGWEHRDFLNYGIGMNMYGRQRNGSVEVYSSARPGRPDIIETRNDIVTTTLDRMAAWMVDYPVIKRGTEQYLSVDIDNPVSLQATREGNSWKVSVQSAGHGLVEGVMLRVTGFEPDAACNINGYWTASIPDGDTVTFSVPATPGYEWTGTLQFPVTQEAKIEYVGEYRIDLSTVALVDKTGLVYKFSATASRKILDVYPGDVLYLVDIDADTGRDTGTSRFTITSIDDDSTTDNAIYFRCSTAAEQDALEEQVAHRFQLRKPSTEGDYVEIGDYVYRVSSGMWEQHERNSLAVPSVLYSRQNIVDVSATNPAMALGDEIEIESITVQDDMHALVRLSEPILHFTMENAAIIEGHTMVFLHNAAPGEYNGWHTVTRVYGQKAFEITVRFAGGDPVDGFGVNGRKMTLREGRWYGFDINGVEWDKIGNRVTYSLDNTASGPTADGTVTTSKEHGLSVGDFVVTGSRSIIETLDADNVSDTLGALKCLRVTAVDGPRSIRLENLDGSKVSAGSLKGSTIVRGVVLDDWRDDLGTLTGEYSRMLYSTDGKMYRFLDGDIVVAASQQNPAELRAWKVNKGGAWYPVRTKRSLKVSALGLHCYRNGEYDETAVEDGEDEARYVTYSDVDVANASGAVYVAGYRSVAKSRFIAPALSDMDTTNRGLEYSSGEDFSNVAPRNDMDPSFKGVPSMKYPLAEKIERLCYLRDANVIDFELIEYLARFLGYDITALGEDVAESSLYRTRKEQEAAIRETVANLPQYYALGGTRSGLRMLMAAFGVIGEALTLWTDADRPYQDMVYREEVEEKVESGEGGQWVPTPYMDIRVVNDSRYPQFNARQSDLERIREQVKVFKPINVVFRDIITVVVDYVDVSVTAALVGSAVTGNSGAVWPTEEVVDELVVDYREPAVNNCAF